MKLRRQAALVLAALCLLLCACGAGDRSNQDSVSVWCLEDDPMRPALEELIRQYNQDPGDGMPVTLRCFPDEESMAAAFDTARPDLLLCSHERAWALEQQSLLRDVRGGLKTPPAYPECLTVLSDSLGRSYFPLGVEVTLLCSREAAPAPGKDWSAFWSAAARYTAETGKPYFAADAYGPLFYQSLLAQQAEFHADLNRDRENPLFRAFYNSVADGVFDGTVALTEHPAALLLQAGELPCAAASSSSLTVLSGEAYAFAPLPGTKAGGELPGTAVCLAVTTRAGRSTRSTAAFLSWLLAEGRADQAALDAGLIPAALNAAPEADTALERELLRLGAEQRFHLYEPGGDYLRNRETFESDFRAALTRFL